MISERHLRRLKSYCSGDFTSIENYEEALADKTQKWHCHHRRELTEDGKFAYSMEDLIQMGEYYNRPSEELILLTESDHRSLHRKHHDISVSQLDDQKSYSRAYFLKNKEKINARNREYMRKYRLKKKELTANK